MWLFGLGRSRAQKQFHILLHPIEIESGISALEKVVFLVEIDFFFLLEIEKAAVSTYIFLFRKF